MAKEAIMEYPDGHVVKIEACDVTLGQMNNKFSCATPNCNVKMFLVNDGDIERAYFRSKDHPHHISLQCTKSSITFFDLKYDESKFDKDSLFEHILGLKNTKKVHRDTIKKNKSIVGENKHLSIRSLGTLYQMCMTRKKTDHYNHVLIDDILADDENFDHYFLNITGYKLVETSFFHIEYDINKNKYEMYMNYPCNNIGKNSWVKLIFTDKKMFFDYYKKFKDTKHIEPIIIAGDWINVKNDPKCFASCIINKTSQIYIEKERD